MINESQFSEVFLRFYDTFNVESKSHPRTMLPTFTEIKATEEYLQNQFPESYCAFSRRFGEVWTPNILNIVANKFPGDDAIYALKKVEGITELVSTNNEYWAGGMPTNFIKFGFDVMGNAFVFERCSLELVRPVDLPVYIFDHDYNKIIQFVPSFIALLEFYLDMLDQTQ
jgi:hypothetical protein